MMRLFFRNVDEAAKVAKGNAAADRRRVADAETGRRKAGQDALEMGTAILEVVTTIPRVMTAAGRAEVERLTKIDPAHPRLTQANARLEALSDLAPMARRLRARASRALAVARGPVAGLHGFVEDASGQPVPGVVATLKGAEGASPRATTAEDGYFLLALPKTPDTVPGEAQESRPLVVVVQSKAGQLLHEDPVPLDPSMGIGYREYTIERPGDIRPDSGPVIKPRRPSKRG